ncbi:MAG: hypothetical protein N0C82_22140, partial [Candidatus Thiodiazotropha endolucinida]|nr:hypothetical protein [Candidatus Thiodiazotropha taylori]MCW4298001.1 hypothetical protein [Candidatus Thiodiazotropha endolucinida]
PLVSQLLTAGVAVTITATVGDDFGMTAIVFAAYPCGIAPDFQATGQYLVDGISYHLTDRVTVFSEIGIPGFIFPQQGFYGGRSANQGGILPST